MERRALLGGLCGITALSGCVSLVDSALQSDSGGPIADREFEVFGPGSDFIDSAPRSPPQISFRPPENRVIIDGSLYVGSADSHEAALEDATYHEDSDTLSVRVGRDEKGDGGSSLVMSANSYRATITFRESLPRSVVAVEFGQMSVESTTADRSHTD